MVPLATTPAHIWTRRVHVSVVIAIDGLAYIPRFSITGVIATTLMTVDGQSTIVSTVFFFRIGTILSNATR